MKTSIFIAILLLAAKGASAQTAVLEYRFNEVGTVAASSGSNLTALTMRDSSGTPADLHSADSLGVSGLSGDRSFDNSASTGMGNAGVGGRADQADVDAIDQFSSFTLQGWFYANSPISGLARLFDDGSTSQGFLLWGNAGTLALYVDNLVVNAGANLYNQTNQWIFFACTYDGTQSTNNLKFYLGTKTAAVSQAGSTLNLNAGPVDNSNVPLTIGNTNASSVRPFDGRMDNMRIFGSTSGSSGVLDQSQLESFRQVDLQNVPEPSTLLLLAASVSFLILGVRSRRRAAGPRWTRREPSSF